MGNCDGLCLHRMHSVCECRQDTPALLFCARVGEPGKAKDESEEEKDKRMKVQRHAGSAD